MIEIKKKKCKGTGQATNSGCGKGAMKRTYGLCDSCYFQWLTTTEPGRVKLEKATLRGKQIQNRKSTLQQKEAKESLKTHKHHLKDLQKVFNSFIRKRDEGKPCISCGSETGKRDAGHYRSVGSTPELRFEELNCFSQCVHCNQHLHGNLINYRIGLIKRIGVEKVEWLEGNHEPLKFSIPEIKDKIKYYKNQTKLWK